MAKSAEARESLLSFFHATHGPIIAIISTSFAGFFRPEPDPNCAIEARSKSRSLHPLQASGRVSVKRLSAFSVNAQLRPRGPADRVDHPAIFAFTLCRYSPKTVASNLSSETGAVTSNAQSFPHRAKNALRTILPSGRPDPSRQNRCSGFSMLRSRVANSSPFSSYLAAIDSTGSKSIEQGNGARYPSFDWLLTRCYICPRTHSSKTQRRKKMKRLRSVHGFLVDSAQLPHPCVLRCKFDAD